MVLNYPYSGVPNPVMQETLRQTIVPKSFTGRLGCLLLCTPDGITSHTCLEPSFDSDSDFSGKQILTPLAEDDIAPVSLKNASGISISLSEFFSILFKDYPDKPYFQGGKELSLRKGLWRAAIVRALKSPTISLLSRYAQGEFTGTPVAVNEMWCGQHLGGDVRHDRTFISPLTMTKPLFDWLTQGLNKEEPKGVWPTSLAPELPVLYEDHDVIVVNKPAKLASVPGIKETVNARDCLETQTGQTLLIVHRLDTDTSGVLLFAKTKQAQSALSEAFRSKLAFKRYRALLNGHVQASHGQINLGLTTNFLDSPRQCVRSEAFGGKRSVTDYEVVSRFRNGDGEQTLIDLYPETGRTHQLRVHCAHPLGLNAPIKNDPFYGTEGLLADTFETKLHLHAAELTVTRPDTGVVIHATCEPPF